MWLSKRFDKDKKQMCEKGVITVSGNSKINTSSTKVFENVFNYSPFGYSYYAPYGNEVLLLKNDLETACVGTKMKDKNLSSGEINICSILGDGITLKNDGSIILNGITIDKNGKVFNKKGELIFE